MELPRPRGHYAKYKRATQHFLQWLWNARSCGVGADTQLPGRALGDKKKKKKKKKAKQQEGAAIPLEIYERVVTAIVQEPTSLTPTLLGQWTRALAACEASITLREQFAVYFPTSADDNDGHSYFLGRLRAWLAALRGVEATAPTVRAAKADVGVLNFSNYYDVLSLSDDFFPVDELDDGSDVSETQRAPSSTTDRDKAQRFDEAFKNDLQIELASLFTELDELSESVYSAFLDVKHQKKTTIEAAAIAKVAIDCAMTVIARIQLRYPSIKTAENLGIMIQDHMPGLVDLWHTVIVGWETNSTSSSGPRPPSYQYVAGTVVIDLIWVTSGLISFTTGFPSDGRALLAARQSVSNEPYNEETTRRYVVPVAYKVPEFLEQQMLLLYNVFALLRQSGVEKIVEMDSLAGWFLSLMRTYFRTKVASIELAFVCSCWIRSVAAVQGDAGLARTVGLALMHRMDLEQRVRVSMARTDHALPPDRKKLALLELLSSEVFNHLTRANPLLAGLMLLDAQLVYQRLGCEALAATPRFRGFCHLYSALRDRELLQPIAFFEDAVQVYERDTFTPSRAAATHGTFLRSYLVSSDQAITNAALDAVYENRPIPAASLSTANTRRSPCDWEKLSSVTRLLKKNDYSVLSRSTSASSWRSLLANVGALCAKELFASRVLSRDMLALTEDLTQLFDTLCDSLNTHHHVDHSVEQVVLTQLLSGLDCLQLDGSVAVTGDARAYLHPLADILESSESSVIRSTCERVAGVITQFFSQRLAKEPYFTLPATARWVSSEFGDTEAITASYSDATEESFDRAMELIEASDGPLTPFSLQRLKYIIIADPAVLQVVARGEPFGLITIFHHAVAGAIRDRRLVEWLLCMGALHHEVDHCRHPPKPGELRGTGLTRDQLSNALAIHCAAARGYKDMVQLVLEAGGLRDLNTVTYRTKDSLLHLAVQHGHKDVYDMLATRGAVVTNANAAGKHVYELTTDSEWKKEIVENALMQRRQEALRQGHKGRDHELQQQLHDRAQRLRHAIGRQRDDERTLSTRKSSTKTNSSNRRVDQQQQLHHHQSHHGHDHHNNTSIAAALMGSMQITDANRPPTSAEDRQTLQEAMAKVTQSGDPEAAAIVVQVLDRVAGSVRYVASPAMSHASAKEARERGALFGLDAVTLLHKYHRQLTASERASDTDSPLGKLQKRASVSEYWVSTAVTTARVLLSCGRRAQGLELFETVERRLLRLPRRPIDFRTCVQLYTEAREAAQLQRVASPDAHDAFAWYLTDSEIEDDEVLMRLDQLQWCSVFTGAFLVPTGSDPHFCCLRRELEKLQPEFARRSLVVALLEERLVLGGKSEADVRDAMVRVFSLAQQYSIAPSREAMQLLVPRLALLGFEFSSAGIKPVA